MRDFLAATRDRVIVFDGSMGATLEQYDLSLEDDYKLPGRCHEALVLNRPDDDTLRMLAPTRQRLERYRALALHSVAYLPLMVGGEPVGAARPIRREELADLRHAAVGQERDAPHAVAARHGEVQHRLVR